jgi:hypothetical protein
VRFDDRLRQGQPDAGSVPVLRGEAPIKDAWQQIGRDSGTGV